MYTNVINYLKCTFTLHQGQYCKQEYCKLFCFVGQFFNNGGNFKNGNHFEIENSQMASWIVKPHFSAITRILRPYCDPSNNKFYNFDSQGARVTSVGFSIITCQRCKIITKQDVPTFW